MKVLTSTENNEMTGKPKKRLFCHSVDWCSRVEVEGRELLAEIKV